VPAERVANEPAALRMFPNVYGVSVACPTSHLRPGVVQAWSTPVTGLMDSGRYPTGIGGVSEAVAANFRAETFSSYPVQDIRHAISASGRSSCQAGVKRRFGLALHPGSG